jgi:hypothetical protein
MAGLIVLDMFSRLGYPLAMPDADEKLTPVDPADLADAIAPSGSCAVCRHAPPSNQG